MITYCQIQLVRKAMILLIYLIGVDCGPCLYGQSSIIYVHFPPTGTNPSFLPYDALGERLIANSSPQFLPATADIMFSGRVMFTLVSYADQELGFEIIALGTNEFVAFQGSEVAPLSVASNIGPGGAGYAWVGGNGFLDTVGNCSFCGIPAAYIGLRFFQDGRAYYGWVQAGAPFPFSILYGGWVYDYAYETIPDTPILAGAVPQAAMAPAALTSGNQIRLNWQTQIGNTYQLQYKPAVASEFPVWANTDFAIVATATNASVQVPILGTNMYYRVVTVQ